RRPRAGKCRWSGAVVDALHARALRAVGAAIDRPGVLDAVADHLAAAVLADRRHRMDGAFERVEGHAVALVGGEGERLVVVVAANRADGHRLTPVVDVRRVSPRPPSPRVSDG